MTDLGTRSWPTEQVVHAAQQGDPRAIALPLEASYAHGRRFARTLCSTPKDAEEAAQDALIVLYRKSRILRMAAALASWLFQMVRNDYIYRGRLTFHRPGPSGEDEASPEGPALARLEVERIVDCIAELPPDQRAVLVLRDVQGLSDAATAQALELSRARMASRLHRGDRRPARCRASSRCDRVAP